MVLLVFALLALEDRELFVVLDALAGGLGDGGGGAAAEGLHGWVGGFGCGCGGEGGREVGMRIVGNGGRWWIMGREDEVVMVCQGT